MKPVLNRVETRIRQWDRPRIETTPLKQVRNISESLSIDDARKLVLLSQGISVSERRGQAVETTRHVIRHLGYVQIDTISVVERAHHHTLWNRTPRYRQGHLNRLVEEGKVFEYWSHAAAYLPMEEYRFALPRMLVEREGSGRWHRKDTKLMQDVLARIRENGPLMSRDFEDPNPGKRGMWDWKPAKYALEQLFIEGRIMAIRREGFNKVYDLTERYLPSEVNLTPPDDLEFARYLIVGFLRANGLGKASDFVHLRQGMREPVRKVIHSMLKEGELDRVLVGGDTWLVLPQSLELLNHRLKRKVVHLLSPFDNLIIQRRRVRELFDFDYRLECYVPERKRVYGYFVLPVLWCGNLVARADLKAHRSQGVLELRNFVMEPGRSITERFVKDFTRSLRSFAGFNGCEGIILHDRVPRGLSGSLERSLSHH